MSFKRILSLIIFIIILIAFFSTLRKTAKELENPTILVEASSETLDKVEEEVVDTNDAIPNGANPKENVAENVVKKVVENADTESKSANIEKTTIKPVEKPSIQTTKLPIPYHAQQYKNSCEAASLKMALEYRGISVNEMDILQKFGYAPRLKDVEKNEWDDPQKMYVGFVDIVGSTIGYGVYGLPVVKAIEAYGRQAEYTTNITPDFLAKNIKAGNPIILWGYTSFRESPYTWNTSDGNIVKAFKGEHARLVVGVAGGDAEGNNPEGFYVHDPFNGQKYQYWSAGSLMAQVNAVPGVTNQAVVVK